MEKKVCHCGLDPQSAPKIMVLRLASADLRDRVNTLFPALLEEDTQVVYVPENQYYTWQFEAQETTIHNTIIIVETGGSLTVNYEALMTSINHRWIWLGDSSRLIINDLIGSEISTDLTLQSNAVAQATFVALGNAELHYTTELIGEDAQMEQWGLFAIANDERARVQTAVNHRVASCKSNALIKGVAADRAHGQFDGMVYVAPDAQRTEAYQQSRNLLLSADCQVVTSPQLEIYADDVKCSHGATVGQQNDDALFYMRQRGLSDAQARRLQLSGFLADITEHYSDEALKDKANKLINNKL